MIELVKKIINVIRRRQNLQSDWLMDLEMRVAELERRHHI